MSSIPRAGVTADFDVYGVVVRVQGPPEVLRLVDLHRPPCWVPDKAGRADLTLTATRAVDGWRIERDDTDDVATGLDDVVAAVQALLGDAHFQISCRSRRFLYIHAGVVGVDGKALLIPGRSHSGKSTLVAELVRRGATYLSDEYAVIGPDLLVHPYARELAMRDEHGTVTPTPVEVLGGENEARPLPPGWILWTRYVKGTAWSPTRVRGSRTVRPLFDNAVLAQDEGAELFDRLSRLMLGVEVWEGDRPDAPSILAEGAKVPWRRSRRPYGEH